MKAEIELFIHANKFDAGGNFDSPQVKTLISFYLNERKSIMEPGSELYLMKQVNDQKPNGSDQ